MKTKSSTTKLILSLITLVLIFMGSCDSLFNPTTYGDFPIGSERRYIDVSRATAMVGVQDPTNPDEGSLHKITEDGTAIQLMYVDENGDEIIHVRNPKKIIDINEEFLILHYDFEAYLVNKNTHYAWLFYHNTDSSFGQYDDNLFSYYNDPQYTIRGDKIYFTAIEHNQSLQHTTVKVIDVSDPDNPTEEELFSDENDIRSYDVDGDDGIYITYNRSNTTWDPKAKYQIRDGELVPVDSEGYFKIPFTDNNLDIRFIQMEGNVVSIRKFNRDGSISDEVSSVYVDGDKPLAESFYGIDGIFYNYTVCKLFTTNEYVFFIIAGYYGYYGFYYDMVSGEITISENIPEIDSVYYFKDSDASDEYMYIVDYDNLHIYDILGDSHITVSGGYEFYSTTVGSDGICMFRAQRYYDGMYVVGEVTSDGEITIIEEIPNQITSLMRFF